MRWFCWIAGTAAMVGCASGEPTHYPERFDRGTASPDLGVDMVPVVDQHVALPDLPEGEAGVTPPKPDAGCSLGTVEHCARCGDTCPPGRDDTSTLRVCQQSTCSIQCKEEAYDVNGQATDGCETQDDKPIHENNLSVKNLGKVEDCDNAQTSSALLPSDDRQHTKAPTTRPNGREDWFSLHISDKAFCIVDAEVSVSFGALPTGGSYRAEAYFVCDNGTTLGTKGQTTGGGGSVKLAPSTSCTTLGDDSGTLYIRIRKLSGPHSKAGYTLSIEP